MDKLQKVRADIERLIGDYNIKTKKYRGMNKQAHQYYVGKRDALSEILKSIDSMQEEPNNCMYSKDDFTDEDRKVLCDGCKEECEYSESDDFTKALAECIHQAQGSVVDPMVFAELWKDELIKLAKSEEPVSEDLGDYINELSKQFPEVSFAKLSRIAVRVAKWKTEHLWKHADGNNLPIIDREVIALLDNGKVVFAHRPPEFWDGKNIITGKVTRNYPKTYDKGGWNIPNVKWWLDCQIPNMGEG